MTRPVIGLLLLTFGIPFVSEAWEPWVRQESYADFHVVVAPGASLSEHSAALEFQRYWELAAGPKISITSAPRPGKINVWIGRADNPYASSLRLKDLGPDGLAIRTYGSASNAGRPSRSGRAKGEDRTLVITGGAQRGTLYGVYQFFEEYFGVRWFTPGYTHISPTPPESLPRIRYRYTPPIAYRDVSYRPFVENPWFAAVHRLNGLWSGVPAELGGHTGYVRGHAGFGHTFHYFIDPETHYAEHPEYFSEIDGQRVKYSQLCLTNLDVLHMTIEKVRELLRTRAPHQRIVSVSQMDWPRWCQCRNCKAVNTREESPSGSLIRFVNLVAAAIEDEFPDAFIDTFAYKYTRKPPKHLRPRDNVIVRLCSVEGDFSQPLSNPEIDVNRLFAEDLHGWKRITKNLYIWDYTQNWYSFQAPHPNVSVLQPNIQFFAKAGVAGVFEQASPFSPHSDFEYLKAYLLAKSLWDPGIDWRRHYNDFIDHYYGEAGPLIKHYLNLIGSWVRQKRAKVSFYSESGWLRYPLVTQAQALFQEAYARAGSPQLRARLDEVFVAVQYAALVCPPRIEYHQHNVVYRAPPSPSFDEYWNRLMDLGVTHLADEPIEAFRERLNGATPPRVKVLSLARLANEAVELWVMPGRGGVVSYTDKRLNQELMTGYRWPDGDHQKWTDWTLFDPAAPAGETPLPGPYRIASRSPSHLTLETALDNGLSIRKTLTLTPGSPEVAVLIELHNTSEESLVPRVRFDHQFWAGAMKNPRIWAERDSTWSPLSVARVETGEGYADAEIDPVGMTRWAIQYRHRDIALVNTIHAVELERLTYRHHAWADHLSLELVPRQAPMRPGERRFLHTAYTLYSGWPPQSP